MKFEEQNCMNATVYQRVTTMKVLRNQSLYVQFALHVYIYIYLF